MIRGAVIDRAAIAEILERFWIARCDKHLAVAINEAGFC
jgi:hypothetical protein